jgi:hypothetical protein
VTFPRLTRKTRSWSWLCIAILALLTTRNDALIVGCLILSRVEWLIP